MPYKDPEVQRKYQREWKARNRAEFLEEKSCEKCGSAEELQVDHRNPADKVSHKIWTWAPERRAVELAKCQVLCVPCHKEKTRGERLLVDYHGTRTGYTKRGCRCSPCTVANADYTRAWRARRRAA